MIRLLLSITNKPLNYLREEGYWHYLYKQVNSQVNSINIIIKLDFWYACSKLLFAMTPK